MNYNFLGIAFISDDIPEEKAEIVYETMNEIIEKYQTLAVEVFDKYLDSIGLESVMGVVIPKQKNPLISTGDLADIIRNSKKEE